jgi:hypothetical protein
MGGELFAAVEGAGDPGKEVAARPESIPMTSGDFIATVLSQPNSAEKVQLLRELIAMQNAERERVCKETFDMHFAELRKALGPIIKTRLNTGTNSKFAALEDLQGPCDPIIFQHGFTYSWDEEALTEGRKCVIMYIYGYGHTKSVRWEAPHFEGNRATNPLQSAGVQSTYGQRYTYKGGFGIVLKGEDTDGGDTIEIDAELKSALDKIKNSASLDDLMNVYKIAYTRYEKDPNMLRLVVGEYNLAKQAIARKPNV